MPETIVITAKKDDKLHEFTFDIPTSFTGRNLAMLKGELLESKKTFLTLLGYEIVNEQKVSSPSARSMRTLLEGSFMRGSPLSLATNGENGNHRRWRRAKRRR